MPSSRSLRPRCRTGLATPCRGPTTGRTSWTCGVPDGGMGQLRDRLRRQQRGAAQGGAIVIKIAITVEAFEAIARTLPLGSVGYEPATKGKTIW